MAVKVDVEFNFPGAGMANAVGRMAGFVPGMAANVASGRAPMAAAFGQAGGRGDAIKQGFSQISKQLPGGALIDNMTKAFSSGGLLGVMTAGISGILGFTKSMMESSKVYTTTASAFFKIFSSMADLFLLPFMPLAMRGIQFLLKFMPQMQEYGQKVANYIEGFIKKVEQVGFWKALGGEIMIVWNAARTWFMNTLWPEITAKWDDLKKWWKGEGWPLVKSGLNELWQQIKAWIASVAPWAKEKAKETVMDNAPVMMGRTSRGTHETEIRDRAVGIGGDEDFDYEGGGGFGPVISTGKTGRQAVAEVGRGASAAVFAGSAMKGNVPGMAVGASGLVGMENIILEEQKNRMYHGENIPRSEGIRPTELPTWAMGMVPSGYSFNRDLERAARTNRGRGEREAPGGWGIFNPNFMGQPLFGNQSSPNYGNGGGTGQQLGGRVPGGPGEGVPTLLHGGEEIIPRGTVQAMEAANGSVMGGFFGGMQSLLGRNVEEIGNFVNAWKQEETGAGGTLGRWEDDVLKRTMPDTWDIFTSFYRLMQDEAEIQMANAEGLMGRLTGMQIDDLKLEGADPSASINACFRAIESCINESLQSISIDVGTINPISVSSPQSTLNSAFRELEASIGNAMSSIGGTMSMVTGGIANSLASISGAIRSEYNKVQNLFNEARSKLNLSTESFADEGYQFGGVASAFGTFLAQRKQFIMGWKPPPPLIIPPPPVVEQIESGIHEKPPGPSITTTVSGRSTSTSTAGTGIRAGERGRGVGQTGWTSGIHGSSYIPDDDDDDDDDDDLGSMGGGGGRSSSTSSAAASEPRVSRTTSRSSSSSSSSGGWSGGGGPGGRGFQFGGTLGYSGGGSRNTSNRTMNITINSKSSVQDILGDLERLEQMDEASFFNGVM